jgi:transposase
MKEKASKYGQRFDEEFQRDAVRMLESEERTAKQLSQELGVSLWSLKRWVKRHGRPRERVKQERELEQEIAKLRRELETVSRQRDILKKALGILGQESKIFTR